MSALYFCFDFHQKEAHKEEIMPVVQQNNNLLILTVRVLPNARRSSFDGLWNGTHLKIALSAPPVDGKANEALIDFCADYFHLRKSAITLLSGHTGRIKRLSLTFPTANDAQTAFSQLQTFF